MATLTYDYKDSTVVLGPLATAADPNSYDLCDEHAEHLTAPRGWQVVRLATNFEPAPPSDPAPWESHSVVLARIFPADRRRGLRDRIVVYRLPLVLRCAPAEVEGVTRRLLVERISHVLALPPDEIDDLLR